MKTDTHPTVYADAVVICSCGATFNIPGTQKETKIEICSECHPFYTGKMKIVDTAGRIDKFRERQAAAEKKKS